jgi:hypothetical protein
MIRPFAQNIWDLRPPVSVEFSRGQHGNAWTPQNTLGRILARVLQAETARMARCPSARPKTAKTKTFQLQRCGLISISVMVYRLVRSRHPRGSRHDLEREPRRIVPLDNIPLAGPLEPAPQPLADPRLRLPGIG